MEQIREELKKLCAENNETLDETTELLYACKYNKSELAMDILSNYTEEVISWSFEDNDYSIAKEFKKLFIMEIDENPLTYACKNKMIDVAKKWLDIRQNIREAEYEWLYRGDELNELYTVQRSTFFQVRKKRYFAYYLCVDRGNTNNDPLSPVKYEHGPERSMYVAGLPDTCSFDGEYWDFCMPKIHKDMYDDFIRDTNETTYKKKAIHYIIQNDLVGIISELETKSSPTSILKLEESQLERAKSLGSNNFLEDYQKMRKDFIESIKKAREGDINKYMKNITEFYDDILKDI